MTRTPPALRLEPLEDRTVPSPVGAPDPSFGTGGKVFLTGGNGEVGPAAVAVGGGRVVVVGTVAGIGGGDFIVQRVNPDGSLDTTFGTAGQTVVDFFGGIDAALAVALDPAGNLLVGGFSIAGVNQRAAVTRLTPAGAIDAAFGLNGRVVLPVPGSNLNVQQLLPDATGVVVAGTLSTGGVDYFAVGRLTAAGAVDAAFGTGGNTTFNFTPGLSSDRLHGAVRDPAGNVVVVGSSEVGAGSAFAVARLTPTGQFDATFGAGGKTTFNLAAGTYGSAGAVAVDAAGRLVVAGSSGSAAAVRFGVARLTGTGAPDGSFGTGGFVQVTSGGTFNFANAVLIQPAGRIVVGGAAGAPGAYDFGLVGLTPAGAVDPSFNPFGSLPGTRLVDFGTDTDFLYDLVESADGRLVAVGSQATGAAAIQLVRLIGEVEKAGAVAAGGPTNGAAVVLDPSPAGALPGTPTAVLAAFGGTAVNVRTAAGDVNGDGVDDTVLATGPGVPLRVAVVSGRDHATVLVAPFAPFAGSETFAGGGFVATGDFDHDGRAEFVVSPDVSGGPRVTVFSLRPDGTIPVRANFFGIDDANFRGGCRTAVGDVNGDGTPDLVVAAGFGGGPRVAVFGGTTLGTTPTRLVGDFFAFPGTDAVSLRNGAFVAVGDVTGDGFADLAFGGGPGGAPRVFILSGRLVVTGDVAGAQAAPVGNFFVAGNAADRGGVRVAVADLDGDTRADVVAGSGEGRPAGLRAYLGKNLTGTGEPATFQDVTLFGGAALPGGVFVG